MRLLNPGEVLADSYQVVRIVGVGGSGAVYLIHDQSAGGVERALKESSDPEQQEQFALEAEVLRPLSHPHLPRVYRYFHHDERDYIVMDFVPGRSLADVLAERAAAGQPPLDESVVIGYAIQICRALEYLHSREPLPVIHRDIKPENIRITPHGELKLVDFGLIKRLDATNPSTMAFSQGLTPVYASPEQWGLLTGTHTDPRSDVYSLAATLYHMLTGQSPMSALNRATGSRGQFRTDDPLIRPRQINPAVSVRTENAILRAMAFLPDERFLTAREFRAALSVGTDTLRAVRRPAD
jgi:eukaryotic-like serine/threonine-protein kinase